MNSNLGIKTTYPFEHYDPSRKLILTFREVTMKDVNLLHSWMHEKHVIPYWRLNLPFKDYQAHVKEFLADDHQTLLIGEINGSAMSYWESYWVKDDVIGNYYEFNRFDQGIHLLIGSESYLGKGYIYPLLLTILYHKFQVSETTKVIAEPDIRNAKMIHVFKKCGFTPIKEIELPDKKGLLMFCERDVFERRWTDWKQNKF
ncbi:GNAT family N-acetyltransferase [Gracilibacillus sp. D59]|uniref:GNAT family N-acetyltransferase n=1 Tax=Gracilibacillus sp. D59 TaxID=3457434 RepID=UPI003FCC9C44